MKRLTVVVFAFLMLGVVVVSMAQDDDCPTDVHTVWQTEAIQIWIEYDDLMKTNPAGIPDVATLQQMRRSLDTLERPPCDDEAHEALQGALNLAGDSIVSNILGLMDDSQRFLDEAIQLQIQAGQLLGLAAPPPPSGETGTITEPVEGAQVSFEVPVKGTYDTALLGDNDLLVFLLPPDGRFYPQLFLACEPEQRATMNNYNRFQGEWMIMSYFGTTNQTVEQDFTIILTIITQDVKQQIYERFDQEWCPSGKYEGYSDTEFQQLVGDSNVLAFIGVTRVT